MRDSRKIDDHLEQMQCIAANQKRSIVGHDVALDIVDRISDLQWDDASCGPISRASDSLKGNWSRGLPVCHLQAAAGRLFHHLYNRV